MPGLPRGRSHGSAEGLLGQLPPGTDSPAGDGGAAGPTSGDPGTARDCAEEAAGGAMNRRVFLSAVTSGLLAAPLAAEAQPAGRMYRIGYLAEGPPPSSVLADPLRELRELGYGTWSGRRPPGGTPGAHSIRSSPASP